MRTWFLLKSQLLFFPTLPGASPLPALSAGHITAGSHSCGSSALFPGPRHLQASPWLLPDSTLQQSDFCDLLSSWGFEVWILAQFDAIATLWVWKGPCSLCPTYLSRNLFSISPHAYEGETVWPSFQEVTRVDPPGSHALY